MSRDGKVMKKGFCTWCGGSLTYQAGESGYDFEFFDKLMTATGQNPTMIDIYAGSLDEPTEAISKLGFVRESCLALSLGADIGGRLGTPSGLNRTIQLEQIDKRCPC